MLKVALGTSKSSAISPNVEHPVTSFKTSVNS
ncbi:Uncharacterised protein [Vibrio cholerae]|nr:Uncharacterised protein [Vibrio cholerae]